MERLNYHEILSKLAAVSRRLEEAGVGARDRIRIHQDNITKLVHAENDGALEEIAVNLDPEKRREILWSFVESIELVDALDALAAQGCEVPMTVLQRAVQGPADVYLEDSNSNLGRNTMFEIALAGRAAAAGLKPRLGGEPDVFFEFANRRMLVHCKRVFSEAKVDKRIAQAAKQLKRDLQVSCDPRDCGLVAVSVSRLINPGDKMLVVSRESDITERLSRDMHALMNQHEKVCTDIEDPRIAGVLFHIATPSFVEEIKLFTVAQHANIYHIHGKSDRELLRALAKTIKM